MRLVMQRRGDVATLALPADARRGVVSPSHLVATMLLTAAIFVLPATADHRPARASIGDISVTSSHRQSDAAAIKATVPSQSILQRGGEISSRMSAAKSNL